MLVQSLKRRSRIALSCHAASLRTLYTEAEVTYTESNPRASCGGGLVLKQFQGQGRVIKLNRVEIVGGKSPNNELMKVTFC